MHVQENKPNVALFLDIDGVLGPNIFTLNETYQFNQIVKNLLNGDNFHPNNCKRCNTCSTAQAHMFKKEVVQPLEDLISRIEEIANVHIVISSMWRKERTVEDLKQIFHMHGFSKYIVDKTVDNNLTLNECNENCHFSHLEASIESYVRECNFSIIALSEKGFESFINTHWACRASQIAKWLKEHPGYAAFGILDDRDEHLSINFGEKFISTEHNGVQILTPEDAEKAYKVVMKQLGFS